MDNKDWFVTPTELESTQSRRDGISVAMERKLREKSVFFIESLCHHHKCKCNILSKSSACVYFHRFYMAHSFKSHQRLIVAVACLFIACKVEEEPKRIKEIMAVYFDVLRKLRPSQTEVTDEVRQDTIGPI